MQYCRQCGSLLEDGAVFCTACGAKVESAQQPHYESPPADGFVPDPSDAEQNKVMAVLSYLGILVLVPVFGAKNSPFAKFHANQGLVLFIADFVVGILSSLVNGALSILSLPLLVFSIMGIVYAIQGKAKPLPLIGSIHILK